LIKSNKLKKIKNIPKTTIFNFDKNKFKNEVFTYIPKQNEISSKI
jgi:hypothetical protein